MSKIKQAKDVQRLGVEKFTRHMLNKYRLPMPRGMGSITVSAEINHDRWIAKCPFCSGAEMADQDDPRFFCLSCFNADAGGKWLKVEFPGEMAEIEKHILKRKKENRNWVPGETIAKLKKENKSLGVV